MRLNVVAASIAIACAFYNGPTAAQAQRVTVSGVVVDARTEAPIVGAAITIERATVLTDQNGRFRIQSDPGQHTLVASALGYREMSIPLELRSDTTLQLVLEPNPVGLDSLVVVGERIGVQGSVRDAATGEGVPRGEVAVLPGSSKHRFNNGWFRAGKIPAGVPVTLVFSVLKYLPNRIEIEATSDTTLHIELHADSVAIKLLARQLRRLDERTQTDITSVEVVDDQDLGQEVMPTIADVIRKRLRPGAFPMRRPTYSNRCVTLDDRRISERELFDIPTEYIERVEIYGSRGGMIRLYTARYIASLQGQEVPPLRLTCAKPGRVQ